MQISPSLQQISSRLKSYNAKAILVGGMVRDHFLNKESKDYDVEVYGIDTIDKLQEILLEFGNVNLVGKSFGILKLSIDNDEHDFSLPRIEHKIGNKHTDFETTIDGNMSYHKAFKRRDFTINSIGYNIETAEFIDPYGGIDDIKNKILRHTNDTTFVEDPLRVYRCIQFVARFNLTIDESTFALCKKMVDDVLLEFLPKERIYEEFKKLLLKSAKPSIGFELMRSLGILQYFPELQAIIDVPQDPKWHPEGDVWTHTMMCIDEMAKLKGNDNKQNERLFWAILCHDFGKATHTQIKDGNITAIGHEEAGIEPMRNFMYRLTNEHSLIDDIEPFIKYHLTPSQLYRNGAKSPAIRRLSTKVNIEELVMVARADFLGRTTTESLTGIYEAGDWLLEKSKELGVETDAPAPILQGRDLISLGLSPSPQFKKILKEIYEAQLDGLISTKDEALHFVKTAIDIHTSKC